MKILTAIIFISLSFPEISFCQNIGFSGAKMWTSSNDLKNPIGVNIFLSTNIFSNGEINFEYSYYQSKYNYMGNFSSGMDPAPSIKENIEALAYLHSIEFSFIYKILHLSLFNFSVGGGLTVINLNKIADGTVTGLESNFDDTRLGLVGLIQLETEEELLSPFTVFAVGKIKATTTFIVTTEVTAPFSEDITYKTIQLGIKLSLDKVFKRI